MRVEKEDKIEFNESGIILLSQSITENTSQRDKKIEKLLQNGNVISTIGSIMEIKSDIEDQNDIIATNQAELTLANISWEAADREYTEFYDKVWTLAKTEFENYRDDEDSNYNVAKRNYEEYKENSFSYAGSSFDDWLCRTGKYN